MDSKIEIARVYDTLLCSPGMDEIVKIDLKISRKAVLILCHAIEKGSDETGKAGLPSLPENISKQFSELLFGISKDCLEKSGLDLLSQKLKALVTAP
ncbi:hypothetical protein [Dyadobacter psychrotolerans]|uniref:Uncharacterized protein n=1 Tax=Dyadobacter psychrotolerans TaxID=2541721 RepID=A0A4R5DL20_9BACT|nr:hypothetical protein [Dyadobacter psychrotolerans]TDE14769.1 hypothetical protein E0F88_16415 [Dyadobacter psychrotolerans]